MTTITRENKCWYHLWKQMYKLQPWNEQLIKEMLQFASRFSYLYPLCMNTDISLQQVINSQGFDIKFRRLLHGILCIEWLEILEIISSISYTHSIDKMSWRWESSGKFTIKSLYKFLNFRGIIHDNALLWWFVPIPLKIRIFMWLTWNK